MKNKSEFKSSFHSLWDHLKELNKKRINMTDFRKVLIMGRNMLWTVGTTQGEILLEMEKIGFIKRSKSGETFRLLDPFKKK